MIRPNLSFPLPLAMFMVTYPNRIFNNLTTSSAVTKRMCDDAQRHHRLRRHFGTAAHAMVEVPESFLFKLWVNVCLLQVQVVTV